jgi:uncharacterized membrane protein (Fun14 family)
MADSSEVEKKKKDLVEQAIEQAKPLLANISFGGVMGFCSGMAMKKVGEKLAVVIGCGFVALQAAVSYGYIEGVNWAKIQADVSKGLDQNGVSRDHETTMIHAWLDRKWLSKLMRRFSVFVQFSLVVWLLVGWLVVYDCS